MHLTKLLHLLQQFYGLCFFYIFFFCFCLVFCGHCIGGDCVAFFTFAFNSQMLLLSVVWDGDEDEVVIRRRFFFGICFGFLKLPLFT